MTFEPENTTTTAFLVSSKHPPWSNYSVENIRAVPDTGSGEATWPKNDDGVAKVTPSETSPDGKIP